MTEPTVDGMGLFLRRDTIQLVCDRFEGPIVILEVGTARNAMPIAEQGDGWSTKHFAAEVDKRGGRLFSIDIEPANIKNSKRIVPQEHHKHVHWHCGDGPGSFLVEHPHVKLDLIYLDAGDDPYLTLLHFGLTLLYRTERTLVLLDDTQTTAKVDEGKGALVLSLARRNNWPIEHFSNEFYRMSLVKVD